MGNTSIEWTDKTWNPIRGCSVVSEGCRNCYAMAVAARFNKAGQAYEGLAYRNGNGPHWTGKVRLIEEHLEDPLRWKKPCRVFVNSMSDLFHESLDEIVIGQIFSVMAQCPQHVFQVLTKRPNVMLETLRMARDVFDFDEPLPNVWLGVSVEDQKTADERIPLLLQTPAAVRWISAEPLLEWLDVTEYLGWNKKLKNQLDWVVAGGESGQKARPMHPYWIESLRDQCLAANVPFFFKQWGEWQPNEDVPIDLSLKRELRMIPADSDNFDKHVLVKVGKKEAGRLLDGREWKQFPKSA